MATGCCQGLVSWYKPRSTCSSDRFAFLVYHRSGSTLAGVIRICCFLSALALLHHRGWMRCWGVNQSERKFPMQRDDFLEAAQLCSPNPYLSFRIRTESFAFVTAGATALRISSYSRSFLSLPSLSPLHRYRGLCLGKHSRRAVLGSSFSCASS